MKDKKKKNQTEIQTFFDKCDSFFAKYEQIWFWILFGVTLLTSILLYDPRVSAGGDDSEYILRAHAFLKEFVFPGYQGALYPIVLSVVDVIFGMSIKAFKIFSMLSMLACIYFMFLAFRRRIPPTLLFITLLLVSVNSYLLYFASQTYSEAFYMFMQALLMFVFFKLFVDREGQSGKLTLPAELKRHTLLAAILLGVIMTRSIGYSLFLAIIGYFIIYRQWKNIGWFAVCFIACFGIAQLLKVILWGDASIQASGQGASLLNKDFYKPELGREDLAGFINRFWTNSNQYISRFFLVMLGLRKMFTVEGIYGAPIPAITILVYLLGLTSICFSYKRNRYLFFSGIATGMFLVVSFVILQTTWNQYRLIVPAFPLMILLLVSALYYLLKLPRLRSFQFLLFVPVVIILSCTLTDTSEATEKTGKLKDEYSGLTPDWLHYAKASAWIGDNLPENTLVACRKPSISSVYGKGKKFYGIYRVNSGSFNAFYERWKTDSLAYNIIPLEGMNDQMYNAIMGHCEARILLNEAYYFAVKDHEFIRQFSMHFASQKIITSPSEFSPFVKKAKAQTAIYYPDSLLMPIRQANVTHLLTANLRLNPNLKNGQTINTVERVATFIQEKYPMIFQKLKQFGDAKDEPAEIYLIDWNVVNN